MSYLQNLWNAIQGKPSEGFQDTPIRKYAGFAAIAALISALPLLLTCYGAARLSWCLNHSYGWAFLCFLFPAFYYPYYALFLNPVCNPVMTGGRRR